MSGEMPPDQWGMLTPGGKARNWDPSNVITKFFGDGAAEAMSETGAVAFKRQLYQSMVGQLLFLKTEIEGWRSQNVWVSRHCAAAILPWPPLTPLHPPTSFPRFQCSPISRLVPHARR
jgi:hypothetical protein